MGQFVALVLLYLTSKREEIILRRVIPHLISVLTVVVSSRGVTHVTRVMKEERMEKTCW